MNSNIRAFCFLSQTTKLSGTNNDMYHKSSHLQVSKTRIQMSMNIPVSANPGNLTLWKIKDTTV